MQAYVRGHARPTLRPDTSKPEPAVHRRAGMPALMRVNPARFPKSAAANYTTPRSFNPDKVSSDKPSNSASTAFVPSPSVGGALRTGKRSPSKR